MRRLLVQIIMFVILMLLLMECSPKVAPSSAFSFDMYVQTFERDTTKCDFQKVTIATKPPELLFKIDDMMYPFTVLGMRQVSQGRYQHTEYLAQDAIFDEPYLISFMLDDKGFTVMVCNGARNFPSFVISTNNLCDQ